MYTLARQSRPIYSVKNDYRQRRWSTRTAAQNIYGPSVYTPTSSVSGLATKCGRNCVNTEGGTNVLRHVAHEQNLHWCEVSEFPNNVHGPTSALALLIEPLAISFSLAGGTMFAILRCSNSEVAPLSSSDHRSIWTTTRGICARISPGAQCAPRHTLVD